FSYLTVLFKVNNFELTTVRFLGKPTPNYIGLEKWEYKVKSNEGADSVVHYVVNPATEERVDFKFKKHSNE
ncbi:hypothetical protein, partial [Myroides sp. DF42-4-2]|uniref:hypothetical protein n=1 Tax=Myroides sp. DF42-4-2 TaxID=2746726 RepID=UPI002577A57B